MSCLQLFSEPFARTGGMAAEGFRRLLGRPSLDLLQTFVREGIQNVVDASKGEGGATVLIRLRTLSNEQAHALRQSVLRDVPEQDQTKDAIVGSVSKKQVQVLEICDFNTEGLSGPTRADVAHDAAESLNFVNFLRNVGAGRDTAQGAGTYGYGKSSLYAISACSTIVVDSLTTSRGVLERRLMACHLGAAYDSIDGRNGGRRFTGRHWWGVLDGDGSVEPATGVLASGISDQLGCPSRGDGQTGTSILVVDPILPEGGAGAAIEEIVETVLWNFWPRMISTAPARERLHVEVELEGCPVAIPAPEEFPPLDLFSAAMAELRSNGPDCIPIRCLKPSRELGRLVIKKGALGERVGFAADSNSVIPRQCSHIALMRPVQLVVKYLQGEAFADARFEWAGVFICSDDDEVEAAFADSEPPAHDDWVPDNLPKGRGKTFVRVGLSRIAEIAKSYAGPSSRVAIGAGEQSPSLAATAARMGALLGKIGATGPGRGRGGGGGGPGRRRTHLLSRVNAEGLRLLNGSAVAVFSAELINDGSRPNLHVVAEPSFVVDGGSIGSEDLPSSMRLRVAEISLGGMARAPGSSLRVGKNGGRVEVLVPVIKDAAISVRLRLQDGDGNE